jgi:class 3 adenylate cyclase
MASLAAPGTIQISDATFQILVATRRFEIRPLGVRAVKGKGAMTTFQIGGLSSEAKRRVRNRAALNQTCTFFSP